MGFTVPGYRRLARRDSGHSYITRGSTCGRGVANIEGIGRGNYRHGGWDAPPNVRVQTRQSLAILAWDLGMGIERQQEAAREPLVPGIRV